MKQKGSSVIIYIISSLIISGIIIGGTFYLKNTNFLKDSKKDVTPVTSDNKNATDLTTNNAQKYEVANRGYSFDVPEGATVKENPWNSVPPNQLPWELVIKKNYDKDTFFGIWIYEYKDLSINDTLLKQIHNILNKSVNVSLTHLTVVGHKATEVDVPISPNDTINKFTYIENNRLTLVIVMKGQAFEKSKYESQVATYKQFLDGIKISNADQEKIISIECIKYFDSDKIVNTCPK